MRGAMIILATAVSLSGACGPSKPTPSVAQQVTDGKPGFRCVDTTEIKITSDSASSADACLVVGMAVHEIGLGHATQLGLEPADSAAVNGATVRQLTALGAGSARDTTYWILSLSFTGRPHALDVNINQTDSTILFLRPEGLKSRH